MTKFFEKRRIDLLIVILLFIIYFSLGAYLSLVKGFLPGDSISRLVSAWLSVYGTVPKLATIGFIWPPIPTLLIIPFTVIPFLVRSWLAVVVVSAFFMAMAGLLVRRITAFCGFSIWMSYLFMLLFAANPMMVIFGANGMSEAILVAVTLAAYYWLIRFWSTNRNIDLILSAAFFSLVPMIRYEMVMLSVWGGVLLLIHTWTRQWEVPVEKFGDFVEGRLLAFSALVIYPTFLWMVVNWQIMGSPIYFLQSNRGTLANADIQLSSLQIIVTPLSSIQITFQQWLELFPLGLIVVLAAVGVGIWRKSPFLVGLGLVPLMSPVALGYLLYRHAEVPLLRYYIMVIPLSFVVMATIWQLVNMSPNRRNLAGGVKNTLLVIILVLFMASDYASGYALSNNPYQTDEHPSWLNLISTADIKSVNVTEGVEVGRLLAKIIPPGSRVLVDTFGRGYAVVLGGDKPSLFLDYTDPNFDKAAIEPWAYVDYVLVPDIKNLAIGGPDDAINHAHPDLYISGEPWAEFMDVLPQTELKWRLYKIIRSP
jgi:hypothetical protein